MGRRIFFDGLNLALPSGTGIATYTRVLAGLARGLGYEIGIFYSAPQRPAKDRLLREIDLLEPPENFRISRRRKRWNDIADQLRCLAGVRPSPLALGGGVAVEPHRERIPPHDYAFVGRNLFANAATYFAWSGRFATLDFAAPPDIVHCTYPLPLRAKGARSVYTIHDLIPLRLPQTTLDDKRAIYRLFRKIAAEADQIVTVSENSRRDIVELLGVDEARVTNTYQAVEFPPEYLARSADLVAEQLAGLFGLEAGNYLLFYGAIEPKKNVKALLDAFLMSRVAIPLVLTGAAGWGNAAETQLLDRIEAEERSLPPERRRVRRLGYVDRSLLVSLIKGARAVVFPSLYEGFGLPVLEAMALGTPVVTSRIAALPEIAGEAALYVDPYDTADIARAIKTIAADAGLCAELATRGRAQAELFRLDRYRERVADLYRRLA